MIIENENYQDWHNRKVENISKASDSELAYARKDLNETIKIQEAGAREGMNCPKLGLYWDEVCLVVAEINRRG